MCSELQCAISGSSSFFAHGVDLVQHQNHRALQLLHQRQRKVILRRAHRHPPGRLSALRLLRQPVRHIHDEQHRIARLQRIVHLLHHAVVELRLRLVHAGRIHQHHLRRRMPRLALGLLLQRNLKHAMNPRPRRLRLVRDDGELLPQQGIQQRGLAGVRPANDRDETRAKGHSLIMRCPPARNPAYSATLARMNFSALLPTLKSAAALMLLLRSRPSRLRADSAPFHSTAGQPRPQRHLPLPRCRGQPGSSSPSKASAKPMPMAKDATGIWTVTTQPLAPEIYGYHFEADGQHRIDPANARITAQSRQLSTTWSPSPATRPSHGTITNVPHGTAPPPHLHHLHRRSASPTTRATTTSTPRPATTPKRKSPTPSSISSTAGPTTPPAGPPSARPTSSSTTSSPQGKIKPMVVVMPLGYGDISFVHSGFDVWQDPAAIDHNTALFTQALLTEVIPRSSPPINVSHKREDRAIAGLSMGGLESSHHRPHPPRQVRLGRRLQLRGPEPRLRNRSSPSLNPKTADLRLLWIACGTDETSHQAQPQIHRLAQDQRHARHRSSKLPACTPGWSGATTSSTSLRSSSSQSS